MLKVHRTEKSREAIVPEYSDESSDEVRMRDNERNKGERRNRN